MPGGPKEKRPAGAINNAVMIVRVATGEIDDIATDDGRNAAPLRFAGLTRKRPLKFQTETLPDSGVSRNQEQAVDQGRLGGSGLLQEFRDLEFVDAVMPGGSAIRGAPADAWSPYQRQATTNPDRPGQARASSGKIHD
jgi:hypothetical protein